MVFIRNWWLELKVDGRETPLAGGPINQGEFIQTIHTRNKGGASVLLGTLNGLVEDLGAEGQHLSLVWVPRDGEPIVLDQRETAKYGEHKWLNTAQALRAGGKEESD